MNSLTAGQNGRPANCGLSGFGKGLTVFTIAAWIILFAVGVVVSSLPYLAKVQSPTEGVKFSDLLVTWIIIFLVYTPTNIALLSICTGLLGALGRCATLHSSDDEPNFPDDVINPMISGVLRGFVAYLTVIAGLIVISDTSPISPPTQEQYIRLAGFISIASFVAGYNPKTFSLLFGIISQVFKKRPEVQPSSALEKSRGGNGD